MRITSKLNITHKMKLILMLTSAVAVVCAGTISIAFNYVQFRQLVANDLGRLADVTGQNCYAALIFDIPEDAREILSRLSVRPTIEYACLYDMQNKPFADYSRDAASKQQPPDLPDAESMLSFRDARLHIFKRIYKGEEQIGTLYIKDDLGSLTKSINKTMLVLLGTIAVALAMAYLLASFLQNLITRPIKALSEAAQTVSQEKDYSVRARKESEDETGRLIDTFNTMLSQIQVQDSTIREREARYREIFNAVSDSLLIIDDTGIIIEANPMACLQYGYIWDELIGMHASKLIDPEYLHRLDDFMQDIRDKGSFFGETVNTRKDNTTFHTEVRGSILHIEGKEYFMALVRDVSERKQAETERMRLVAAIEQSVELIVITDNKARIQYVNPSFEAVTGYSREEVIGKTPGILKSDRQSTQFYDTLWRTITRGDIWHGHLINRKKDGALYDEDATITPIRDKSGEIINYVAVKRDVTQELKLEQQVRQSQKMEAIGTLAGGIAHDFNNILSAIMGYTQLSMTSLDRDSQIYDQMGHVFKAATRAKDLVQQILSFSRHSEQQKRPIKIIPIIQEVCKFLRASLPTTIEIQKNLETAHDVVVADPTQIHQVLMNLSTNAWHAMRQSGGVLEITLDEVRLGPQDLVMYPDLNTGPYVKLTIRDTGHGINQDLLDRIFDPYFTTKKKGEGTGLGLSVVHGIIKNHGGSITVYSEAGKGTTFHILLPQETRSGESADRQQAAALPRGTETILFVDDEEDLVDFSRQMLGNMGYTIEGTTSPVEAIEIFKKSPDGFDLVITDKTMPQKTGFELVEEIRSLRTDIPVIVCTGHGEQTDLETAEALGIQKVVMKPVTREELAQIIRSVLQNK